MKILFVCRGNIGRSQMAEVIYNSLYPDSAKSAGTIVHSENQKVKDRPGAKSAIEAMHEIGLDISNNVSTQLNEEMLDDYDKVVVMAEPETIPDFLRKSKKFEYWQVDVAKDVDLKKARDIREKIASLISEMKK